MKRIILATAIVAVAATSGQAFARSGAATPRQEAAADQRAYIDQQAYDTLNAFDQEMVPQMTDADAHRYHGGPKSND
ncbi:hypothetical protein [Bradyrhizobium sp. USDA 10063]